MCACSLSQLHRALTKFIVSNRAAICVSLLHLHHRFDGQGCHATLSPLPLRVSSNAAVKPLPAVNNGTLCVKTSAKALCVCVCMRMYVCVHTCAAAVGSMYVLQPVAKTWQPAATKAQGRTASFMCIQPTAAILLDHVNIVSMKHTPGFTQLPNISHNNVGWICWTFSTTHAAFVTFCLLGVYHGKGSEKEGNVLRKMGRQNKPFV